MRKFLLFAITMFGFIVNSQNLPEKSEDYYDFWIGHWEVTWDEGDSIMGRGTNTVEATLDGKVIQENFRITKGQSEGFRGTSISVYQHQQKIWRQSWGDNQGGFYNFFGDTEGAKRIFKTAVKKKGDKEIVLRMVFYDIQKDSFKWDWESSIDAGQTWKLNWRINYKRLIENELTKMDSSIDFGKVNPKAPKEIEEFGQFVGSWDCTISNLTKDGSWKEDKATWVWKYILNGMAIQDYWTNADLMGTNIRIFDPKKNKWINTWTENGNLIMSGLWDANKTENGNIELHDGTGEWLIIFFNIRDNSFDWKWDFLQEDGSMKTMSKIYGTRIN